MGKTVFFAFSAKGLRLAESVAQRFFAEGKQVEAIRPKNLREEVESAFCTGNTLVFVGAAGIAVRAVAPFIQKKTTDPAVLVMDETGKYVIPILSGHIGGANRMARRIAGLTGAEAVITTATDLNGVFAVDVFAAENGYTVENPEMIVEISSALLDGREVGFAADCPMEGELPKGCVPAEGGGLGVYFGEGRKQPFDRTLRLVPKRYHVGIGARRGIDYTALKEFFLQRLEEFGILPHTVGSISSIELKKDEEAIVRLAEEYRIPFIVYTAEELSACEGLFAASAFVRKTTGAGNICEAAAYLSAGQGEMIGAKTARDGATMAVARVKPEKWRVSF